MLTLLEFKVGNDPFDHRHCNKINRRNEILSGLRRMRIIRSTVSVMYAIDRQTRGDGMEVLIGYMITM